MLVQLAPRLRRVSTRWRGRLAWAARSLVEPGRRRAPLLAALAALLVPAVDAVLARGAPSRAIEALLDEPAHAATALLFFGAVWPRSLRGRGWGVALGAVLLDVDHLPMELGWAVLTGGTNRPYSHSLLAPIGAGVIGLRLTGDRRRFAFAVAFGLAAHLVRDLATGGVPLFWPLAGRVRLPYNAYAIMLLVAVGLVAWRAWRGDRPPAPFARDARR